MNSQIDKRDFKRLTKKQLVELCTEIAKDNELLRELLDHFEDECELAESKVVDLEVEVKELREKVKVQGTNDGYRINERERELIKALYERAGYSAEMIGDILSRNKNSIVSYIKFIGLKKLEYPTFYEELQAKRLSFEEIEIMTHLHKNGLSVDEISRLTRRHRDTVIRQLKNQQPREELNNV